MKFKDIYKTEQKDNFGMGLYDVKLSENDTIKNKIKNHKININEKLLEDKEKKDKFESELNEDMGKMFKIYDNLLENNDKNFFNKIAIMKNIYNNLSNSKIKENIDETNKKILGLKTLKEKILKNNEDFNDSKSNRKKSMKEKNDINKKRIEDLNDINEKDNENLEKLISDEYSKNKDKEGIKVIQKIKSDLEQTCSRYECLVNNKKVEYEKDYYRTGTDCHSQQHVHCL